jgi:hypothetical protein
MANSNTYYGAIGNDGAQVTTLSNIQGAGLSLPLNTEQYINLRSPGKLETLFNSKNKPIDLYAKGLISSELAPPFYANPNQGQRQKINASRSFPIQSALRDGTRIRRFLGSGKGSAFLTKQILLQGFAPFDETKIYNPASPLLAAVRLSTFGAIERPTRFIDSSNLVGGLMGAAGLGGITKAIGGLFGATEGNPSPPRSSVASAASQPKDGLGGFFNFTGLLGGGDKTNQVMPITGRDGVKGLLRGNTATSAYNNKRYKSLMSNSAGKGGFFGNLLKAAGSFLKNNTILGGLLPPTQPIAGLNYRADEDTYDLMLNTNRWSNSITQDGIDDFGVNRGGKKSQGLKTGVNQGNTQLFSGTQPVTKGGFIGALLKGVGFQYIEPGNGSSGGTSGMRFFATPLTNIVSKRLRLYVQTNKNLRNNSFLSVTYSTTPGVGKLTDSYTINNVEISSVTGASTNRYGDLVKIDGDIEYSDQLLNYKQYTDPQLSVNYQRTLSDKTDKTVQYLQDLNVTLKNKIAGTDNLKYGTDPVFGKIQQNVTNDVGFNYLTKVKSDRTNPEGSDSANQYTYTGRIRYERKEKFPTLLGKKEGRDRFIRPTNNVDYVNSLGVLNADEFAEKYNDQFNGLGPDLVKFYFYDIVNNRFIPFNATVKGLQENNTSTWEPIEYLGRPDKLYYYKGFTRDVSFNFKVVAHSVKELLPMWQRVNYLVGLTRPSNYTSTVNGGFMIPPMVQFTLGDFYKNHCVVLNSCNVSIPEDASWELINESTVQQQDWSYNLGNIFTFDKTSMKGKVAQFPREAEITINMSLMEKDRPKTGRALWGNAPVATMTQPELGETATVSTFGTTDVYTNKDYSNVDNNDFSTNMRYDVDVQGNK